MSVINCSTQHLITIAKQQRFMPVKMKYLVLILVLLLSTTINAQLKINIGVDTTTEKSKLVINFYNKYIADFKEDNEVNYADYFSTKDVENFRLPDKTAIGLIGNTTNYVLGDPYILSLDTKSDTVKAKVMFAGTDSLENLSVYFIANYYIKIDNGDCKFLVNQNIETEKWQTKKIRNITFHYPPYHTFNIDNARRLIDALINLEKTWELEPLKIDYYFAKTNKEIQAIKGFDFNFYMARSEYPGGLAYEQEKSIYSWGHDENYLHEFIHLYLNPVYPDSPLKEGIATFYGGSMGKSYTEHLIRLNDYIKEHPDINIANPEEFYYLDEITNPQYAIQAFICYLVYRNKGLNGLKQLLKIDKIDEIFRKEFLIEPQEQNKFLREQIKKNVEKTDFSTPLR